MFFYKRAFERFFTLIYQQLRIVRQFHTQTLQLPDLLVFVRVCRRKKPKYKVNVGLGQLRQAQGFASLSLATQPPLAAVDGLFQKQLVGRVV